MKLQKETNLDQMQQLHLFDPKPYEIKTSPKPRPMAEGQPSFVPPSDIVVYAYCEGQAMKIGSFIHENYEGKGILV